MEDIDYDAYRKSKKWRELVNQRLEIDHYTCQMCGSLGSPGNPLQIHHFSYRHLGDENVWVDLVTVCDTCHQLISRLMNRVVDENGRLGWSNKYIPKVATFTINGWHQEHRRENLENARGDTKKT